MTQEEFEMVRIKTLYVRRNYYAFKDMAIGEVLKVNTKQIGKTHAQVMQSVKINSAAMVGRELEARRFGDFVVIRCFEEGGDRKLDPRSKKHMIYPFGAMAPGDVINIRPEDYGKTQEELIKAAACHSNTAKAKRDGVRVFGESQGNQVLVRCLEVEKQRNLADVEIGDSMTFKQRDYGKSIKKMCHEINKMAYKKNMRFKTEKRKDEVIATRTH